EYAQQFRLPAKRSPLGKLDEVKLKLEARLRERLSAAAADKPAAAKPLVQKMEDYQVFLQQDHPLLTKSDNFIAAQRIARDWLLDQPYVVAAFTREDLIKSGSGKLFQQV